MLNPWDRQPGESTQAYAAFCRYRDGGKDRSIDAAWRTATGQQQGNKRATGRWTNWSFMHDWTTRAAAYDAHMAAVEQASREAALAERAALWVERQLEQREREWQAARALFDRAEQMLAFPLTVTETTQREDGATVTVVTPARWTFRDVATYFETAAKLARLAADMHTQTVGVRIDDVLAALPAEFREAVRGALADAIAGA